MPEYNPQHVHITLQQVVATVLYPNHSAIVQIRVRSFTTDSTDRVVVADVSDDAIKYHRMLRRKTRSAMMRASVTSRKFCVITMCRAGLLMYRKYIMWQSLTLVLRR